MPVATRSRRVVHQKAKGPVDPGVGLKVRQLRTARGMTQAQLAGPDFSKGFISLLETGRTRISLRAAHILAARLGVEVTDLLATPTADRQDVEFMLLRAEQELRAGHMKVASDIAEKWLKRSSGILKARFQRLQARALIETTRSPEAVKLLDEALRTFRSLGAKDFVARALYDLARAHARLDAPGESLKYALDAEQAVQRGDVVDRTLELEIHRLLAGAYFVLGDPASMEIRAERARAIAEDVADPAAVAKLYGSLALTRYEQGDKEAALVYLRKSIDLYDTVGQVENAADTWNTLGWLFVQRDSLEKAEEALDRAEALAKQHEMPRLLGWTTLNRGAIALARGELEEAVRLAHIAAKWAPASPTLRARALLLYARALAAGDASLALVRRAFEDAVAAHKSESAREQARAHQYYADALSERKQSAEAFAEARKALELVGPKI